MEELRRFWKGPEKLLALIGMGGSGKTALAQEFIQELLAGDPPDGLLVWSFYDDPDADAFLRCAYGYFTGQSVAEAKGAGWFHLLKEAFDAKRSFLILLDGLERVQRPSTDATGIYGEVEDPLLRSLLVRLASSAGDGKVIVTTRFPLADIERASNARSTFIDINRLSERTSRELLRKHGVRGEDAMVSALTEQYGRHALTIDLLGGAISRLYGGDVSRVPRLDVPGSEDEAQASRLATVLGLYEERLSIEERDLMSRLCVFRFGVSLETLRDIFLQEGSADVCGSLRGLGVVELESLLRGLVTAHLVYREDDGRYTVHPAVRDHFYRLFRDSKAVHTAVTSHLMSLGGRPGIGLPKDKRALDLLEELIFHAISGGNVDQALDIYETRLGGNEHLNATLGEYGRTYRILQAFPVCPDPGAMYLCHRAFGNFDRALDWRPQNRYILLACGRITELCDDPSERIRRVARFLKGDDVAIPDRLPDYPVFPAYLQLMKGAVQTAEQLANREIDLSMYRDDLVRNEMALVEVARKKGDLALAEERLEAVSAWVLNSGSQEHLCYLSLVRAGLSLSLKRTSAAELSISEGLDIAKECSFRLFEVDLLGYRARLRHYQGRFDEAIDSANEAYDVANGADGTYYWGTLQALASLVESQASADRPELASRTLQKFREMSRSTREPALMDVERQLSRLCAASTQ